MKKTILLLLTLSLILSVFVSCDKGSSNDFSDTTGVETSGEETTAQNSEETTTETTEETKANTLSDATVDKPEIERPLLTLEDANMYTEFLDSTDLPEDFVSYDKIEVIGDFDGLVILSDAYLNDYSSYMYNLVDATGFDFVLYVDHVKEDSFIRDPISSVNEKDLRKQLDTSRGIYVCDNIVYTYITEGLLSIAWEDQNITYKLSGSFYKYPLAESTFIGKMLDTDTAQQALNTVLRDESK